MVMARYVMRRFLLLLPQMLLISIATFTLIRLIPGNPARLQLGPLAPQEGVDALSEQLHLNDSVVSQYLGYLGRVLHGDFGRSWVNQSDVRDDLVARIPATLELMVFGLVIVFAVMVPLAILSASRGTSVWHRVLRRCGFVYGMLAGALPDFWLGLMLTFVLYTQLNLLPGPEGRLAIGQEAPPHATGAYTLDALLAGDIALFGSAAVHLILPAFTLAFVYGAPIFKMSQSTMSQALRSDYTLYAESFNLPRRKVFRYAARNAAPPVIVIAGVVTGYLLGGAVLIETVFNLNGIGQYAVTAITTNDYAPIQAFVLIAALFTMVVYLLVDLLHFSVDPRVRNPGPAAGTRHRPWAPSWFGRTPRGSGRGGPSVRQASRRA